MCKHMSGRTSEKKADALYLRKALFHWEFLSSFLLILTQISPTLKCLAYSKTIPKSNPYPNPNLNPDLNP